ncbi:hypothetical protein ABVK25_000971 [Lepraria finkii]|uniref:Uncharacterized protein n=1 Tax=Lepraria finkii TaxID=1340010 RepID=A0ABR4BSP6_9LECA
MLTFSLPRIVADQLIEALRDIYTHDSELNIFDKMVQAGFKHYWLHYTRLRKPLPISNTSAWTQHTGSIGLLNRTDYHLSLERRQYLQWRYGIDLIPDDP